MIYKIKPLLLLTIFLFIITGCANLVETAKQDASIEMPAECYVIYDAGSSGTRLFIYEKQKTNWLVHSGPKVSALADPVREIRGKTNNDIDAVTTEVVTALDAIKQDGSIDKEGKAKWQAFNWSKQCHVVSVDVYATAGMRIAEQKNMNKSLELWNNLKQKLKAKMGEAVQINTRTLTGFEEGLFAWLTVRDQKKNNDFGLVEMGGASSQVTFPCAKCDPSDNATRPVLIDGTIVQMYSYSFLGLGKDEAPKTLGNPASCSYGIGQTKKNWKVDDCASQITLMDSQGIRDPYNFNGNHLGTYRQIPTNQTDVKNWVLTDNFNRWSNNQINTCCVNAGQCTDESNACFRAVYFSKYLQSLNVPQTSEKMNTSWTLGAVICGAENCLQKATPLICRWLDKGCL